MRDFELVVWLNGRQSTMIGADGPYESLSVSYGITEMTNSRKRERKVRVIKGKANKQAHSSLSVYGHPLILLGPSILLLTPSSLISNVLGLRVRLPHMETAVSRTLVGNSVTPRSFSIDHTQ